MVLKKRERRFNFWHPRQSTARQRKKITLRNLSPLFHLATLPTNKHASYTAQNAAVQRELTLSCLRGLGLDWEGDDGEEKDEGDEERGRGRRRPSPSSAPLLVLLDAGCGSGLSSAALQPPLGAGGSERGSSRRRRRLVLGIDSSPEMLLVAASSSSASSASSSSPGGREREPPPPPLSGRAVCGDLGQPSPFAAREIWRRKREQQQEEEEEEEEEGESAGEQQRQQQRRKRQRQPLFDAAVSVSAIQWLCHDHPRGNPQKAMRAFFAGMRESLAPGAGAVLQSYPRLPRPPPSNPSSAAGEEGDDAGAASCDDEASALAAAARAAGFRVAAWFVDLPHARGCARKAFLGLVAWDGGAAGGEGAGRRFPCKGAPGRNPLLRVQHGPTPFPAAGRCSPGGRQGRY